MPDYVEPAEGNVYNGIWCFFAKNKQVALHICLQP